MQPPPSAPTTLGMRPWELPRPTPAIPIVLHPRLRRTYGKWRALKPVGPAGRPSSYRWQPLLPAEHAVIDEITQRERERERESSSTTNDRSVAPVTVAAASRPAPTPTATFPMDAIDAVIDYLRYP